MKILHTSDWHLGSHFIEKSRTEEHNLFLNWLVDKINEEQIDLLIISGDIFDTSHPSNSVLKQYFDFLKNIQKNSNCKALIIGGNHDAPSTLNAPKELLESFNIYVIGGAEKDLNKQIIIFNDKDNKPIVIACAVPFLRSKDVLKGSNIQISFEDKAKLVANNILEHYNNLWQKALDLKNKIQNNVPIIATGHFWAFGSTSSEPERSLYFGNIGNLEGININSLSSKFDYIALGHLHKAQRVNKQDNIRYSGSPICLSFDEASSKKSVVIIEFDNQDNQENLKIKHEIRQVEIPCFREFIKFEGDLNSVLKQIEEYNINKSLLNLDSWASIYLKEQILSPYDKDKMESLAKTKQIEIIKIITAKNKEKTTFETQESNNLAELTPDYVFREKIKDKNEQEKEELFGLFKELLLEIELN